MSQFTIPAATLTYAEFRVESKETGFKIWDLHLATLAFCLSTVDFLPQVYSDPASRKLNVFKMRHYIFIESHGADVWKPAVTNKQYEPFNTIQVVATLYHGLLVLFELQEILWQSKYSSVPSLSFGDKALGCLLFSGQCYPSWFRTARPGRTVTNQHLSATSFHVCILVLEQSPTSEVTL